MGFYTVGQCVSSMFCSAHMTSFVIFDQNVQIVFLCSISDLSFSYKRRKSKIKKNLYCCLALAVMGHCEELCKDLFFVIKLWDCCNTLNIRFIPFCLFCIDISMVSKYAYNIFLSLCTVKSYLPSS